MQVREKQNRRNFLRPRGIEGWSLISINAPSIGYFNFKKQKQKRLNMRMKLFLAASTIVAGVTGFTSGGANAAPILFTFDDLAVHSGLPSSYTVGGLTSHFSATGQGFSIQAADVLGFTPAGFSGNVIYPNSVFAADLLIRFDQPLTDFSILYAPEEYATDSSARMRVTAFVGSTLVGTNTQIADPPGTWPTATLSFSSALGFDNVVVHYDAPPITGGDYGPIFMADNMLVTLAPSAVPLPASLPLFATGLGAMGLFGWRRRRKAAAGISA